MNSLSKKILGAFIDIKDDEKDKMSPLKRVQTDVVSSRNNEPPIEVNSKFTEHFNKLFAEANMPGPDYYEFSKMIDVMHAIPDDKSRYCAAFAGLQVQGLDKQKLLSSTAQYLQILEDDTATFHHTATAAFKEKVDAKKEEIENAKLEMQKLSQQIVALQEQVAQLTTEIAENEAKISANTSGYDDAAQSCKSRLLQDIEKINQHII
jgi:hypothetical protein